MQGASRSDDRGVPFGRYLLRERLAAGGMGEVFRAVAMGAGGFEKPVVVKRILPQLAGEERLARMFVEEARVMSRLVHPNLVQVIDFGQGEHDDYFLVLELVEGVDLGKFRQSYRDRNAQVPIPIALRVVQDMLRGLGHAHQKAFDDGRLLVHRDVSPGNVLLSTVGEVKVADFGVALVGQRDHASAQAELLVGKLSYMAPEQYQGAQVDPRADLFSVAVVAFELLTHELPFCEELPRARQAAAGAGRHRVASSLRPEVSPELDAWLAQALAPAPPDRFQSARAMVVALEQMRAEGQEIASADDLAAAVEQAQSAAQQRGQRVIALRADRPDDATAVRELTRTAAAQFTMREATAQEPPRSAPAPRPEQTAAAEATTEQVSPARDAPRPWRPWASSKHRAIIGIGLGLALGSTALWLTERQSREDPGESAAGHSSAKALGAAASALGTTAGSGGARPEAATSAHDPVLSSPEASTPGASSGTAQSASARATGSVNSTALAAASSPGALPTAAPSAATAPSAASSAAEPTAPCEGDLHVYASHGWTLAGGPMLVQAPGRYRWPCGSYTLHATSRLDPTETRQAQASVLRDHTTVLDLRP